LSENFIYIVMLYLLAKTTKLKILLWTHWRSECSRWVMYT